MSGSNKVDRRTSDESVPHYDVVLVGAGITGLYQLIRLRELGMNVRVLESGSGVGGTWHWNRYPGARFDSESYSYGYFFDKDLHDEWSWSEEFAGQPEIERYLSFVADKFALREHIDFNTRMTRASYDDKHNRWEIETEDGQVRQALFLITAVGILSAPQFPDVPGLEDFKGEAYHTGLWPNEPVSFEGKRVAVVGTGSSGVQIISSIGPQVEHLTVFQRTPNWCTPLNNRPILADRAEEIRRTIDEIYETTLSSPAAFIHRPRAQSGLDVSQQERLEYFEQLYAESGMTMYAKNFQDFLTNPEVNRAVSEFIADKIRSRVIDPETAKKLIPDDHGYGMKRPPLETGYFEVYNQSNVDLIDLRDEPIETFTETGLRTHRGDYEFDMIVLATGFDAVTGALLRIEFQGVDGTTLADAWADGPRTYLGMQVEGFPNLFMLGGPQGANGNFPRVTETQVDWVTALLRHMRDAGFDRAAPQTEHVEAWIDHVNNTVSGSLLQGANSWSFGSNVPGKKRAYLLYGAGAPSYRNKIAEAARDGYRGIALRRKTVVTQGGDGT